MKITRRNRSNSGYVVPSVYLIELESAPVLAASNNGGGDSGAKGINPQEGGITDGDMDSNLNFVGDTLGY